ncbi:hypothetical protein [Microcoleus sp. bin38.metabat.b11b12b14.051]|uniref:hypothetical protein n=1 Tax=Microcoleus sp. bin38.metabat.b11b12b14.051 TaxID=2742709 RepID=UPI0025D4BF7F|nr:hypothetical protein [Microcoleus sp. bin38.metabat.b11b12b14.051]
MGRQQRTGGTPIPQTCVNYLIRDPEISVDRSPIAHQAQNGSRVRRVLSIDL